MNINTFSKLITIILISHTRNKFPSLLRSVLVEYPHNAIVINIMDAPAKAFIIDAWLYAANTPASPNHSNNQNNINIIANVI